jgi:uncharacterized protein (TIGR00266 family)
MEYEIYYKPTYSLAEVRLSDGESIQADRRSMAYMSVNLSVSTGIKGGALRGLKRTVLGGADIFLNMFVAQGDAVVGIAPPYVGDIAYREIKDETLLIQGDSFLAGSQSLDLDTKWGGVKGFLSEAGLFFVKVSQSGYVFISSFGAIQERRIDGRFRVDTGHIVGFTEGLDWKIGTFGGVKSTVLGGEVLVTEFSGEGTVYIQSRSEKMFVDWLTPLLPQQEKK